MTIPEEAYLTGIWEVDDKERYEAEDVVRTYQQSRTPNISRLKSLPAYRIGFMLIVGLAFVDFFPQLFDPDATGYIAVIDLLFTALSVIFVIFLKKLTVPAIASVAFLVELIRVGDWYALGATIVGILICNAVAFFYNREVRYLKTQPGYPDFHSVQVKVTEDMALTERDVPESTAPSKDPYADMLSPL